MFKVCLLISLAIAGASAQAGPNAESAPEPYSYGYATDTHSAAEQRDPSGKVTGFYTLTGEDGRQRRVEYVADEAGFRAKVETNEVGTKSENSADVEVLASPPTGEQLVQQTVSVQQPQPQRVASQQVVGASQRTVGVQYAPQQVGYGYGYYPGYGYGSQYSYGVAGSPYGYGAYNGQYYSNYNNPSSYYKSVSSTVQQPAQYAQNAVVGRYVTSTVGAPVVSNANYRAYQTVVPQSVGYQTVGVPQQVGYQTVGVPQQVGYQARSSYQTVGVPQQVGYQARSTYQTVGVPQQVGYQARSTYQTVGVPQQVGYQTGTGYSTVGSTSNLLGSSNYIVLKKKRESAEAAKEQSS